MKAFALAAALGLSGCALWQTPQEIDASRRQGPVEPPGPNPTPCGWNQPACPSGFKCEGSACVRTSDANEAAGPAKGVCNSDADCAGSRCQAGFCQKTRT